MNCAKDEQRPISCQKHKDISALVSDKVSGVELELSFQNFFSSIKKGFSSWLTYFNIIL